MDDEPSTALATTTSDPPTELATPESEFPPPRPRFDSATKIPDIRSPEFQEFLAGWVTNLDSEVKGLRKLKTVPKRLANLEKAIGQEPDPSENFEGTGIKRALSLLLADRKFYRRLIGTLSTLALILETIRVIFHVSGGG